MNPDRQPYEGHIQPDTYWCLYEAVRVTEGEDKGAVTEKLYEDRVIRILAPHPDKGWLFEHVQAGDKNEAEMLAAGLTGPAIIPDQNVRMLYRPLPDKSFVEAAQKLLEDLGFDIRDPSAEDASDSQESAPGQPEIPDESPTPVVELTPQDEATIEKHKRVAERYARNDPDRYLKGYPNAEFENDYLDDGAGDVWMYPEDVDRLSLYNSSVPTGVYEGKCWLRYRPERAQIDGGWREATETTLCAYVEDPNDPRKMRIKTWAIYVETPEERTKRHVAEAEAPHG